MSRYVIKKDLDDYIVVDTQPEGNLMAEVGRSGKNDWLMGFWEDFHCPSCRNGVITPFNRQYETPRPEVTERCYATISGDDDCSLYTTECCGRAFFYVAHSEQVFSLYDAVTNCDVELFDDDEPEVREPAGDEVFDLTHSDFGDFVPDPY